MGILNEMATKEMESRMAQGKLLAEKFPELRGLPFKEFLEKCPLDLDFITACEMHSALNPKDIKK